MESNPQLVQIVPPNEVVVLISFELTLGDVRGMMNLCIPFNAIERIGNKLTTNNWVSYARVSPTEESIQKVSSRLGGRWWKWSPRWPARGSRRPICCRCAWAIS